MMTMTKGNQSRGHREAPSRRRSLEESGVRNPEAKVGEQAIRGDNRERDDDPRAQVFGSEGERPRGEWMGDSATWCSWKLRF